MVALEIIVLLIGLVVIVLSFLISGNGTQGDEKANYLKNEKVIKDFLDKEFKLAQEKIKEDLQETSEHLLEKSERAMDRFSNEKIMEITEYSDSVILQVQKNHEEVVFLYEMMNEKQGNLKNTAVKLQGAVKEVDETIIDVEERVLKVEGIVLSMEEKMNAVNTAVTLLKETTLEVVKVVNESKENPTKDTTKSAKPTTKKSIKNKSNKEEKLDVEDDFRTENVFPQGDTEDKLYLGDKEDRLNLIETEKIMKSKNPKDLFESIMKAKPDSIETTKSPDENNIAGQNKNERILELNKQGKSNVLIAKELGIGVGEVKLVIDLFKGK